MNKQITLLAPSGSVGIRFVTGELSKAFSGLGHTIQVRDHPDGKDDAFLHFHYGNSTRGLLPYILAARQRAVITLHDVVPRNPILRIALGRTQALLMRRHQIVVHSRYSASLLKSLGFKGDIGVIPLGANEFRFDPEEILRVRNSLSPQNLPIFTLAGILKVQKGVGDVISAASKFPGIIFLCVGRIADAETSALLESAPQNVVHVDSPNDEAFLRLIAASDLLLNFRRHSVGETSAPVTQAHALGTPVAGYAVGSLPEYCGKHDFIFPLDTPVAVCISQIVAQRGAHNQRIEMGAAEVARWSRVANEYLELYRTLRWI